MDLFDKNLEKTLAKNAPLANRMRPRNLKQFVGQKHIIGKNTLLYQSIKNNDLGSMILWGPPGCGKTTLANVIAQITNSIFVELSAVSSGKKDLLAIIDKAKQRRKFNNQRTILFIDEIHRWNKAQQDALLPYVEKGIVTLIGATTENPSFEIVSPLLSRCSIYTLKPLVLNNLKKIIKRALHNKKRGLGNYKIKLTSQAEKFLIKTANGDARIILNALEIAVKNTLPNKNNLRLINRKIIEQALQHKAISYDKAGDEHYNVISAFIKSIRGSDVDAGLYWLARMIEAGEDPKFIARRMVILASEDIGNAQPTALLVANAVFNAVEKIGLPECELNLAQGVIYLSLAKKSNKVYTSLNKAKQDVKKHKALPVPLHLRNAPTKLMKELGYGENYKYPHNQDDNKQNYRPKKINSNQYYKKEQ